MGIRRCNGALGLGYLSPWAEAHLPYRHARNAFYTQAGYLIPPGRAGVARLHALAANLGPEEILAGLRNGGQSERDLAGTLTRVPCFSQEKNHG